MLSYIKRKIEKYKIKRTFKKYGSHIEKLNLEKEGLVEFAVWDNPLERPKTVNQEVVDFYKRLVPKGCLAIDIGAHIGDTTVPIALAAGKEGVTLAFEPNPLIFEILSINARLNLDKTQIIPSIYAIAVEPGEYYYNSSEATHNNGGISKNQKNKHGKYQLEEKVTAVNLSDFLKNEPNIPMEKLGFIKIDIEGMDLDILQSIKGLIAEYRPTIIAECFKRLENNKRDQLFDLFDSLNFELFKIDDFNAHTKIQKLNRKEDMRKWKFFDFYAIPKKQ